MARQAPLTFFATLLRRAVDHAARLADRLDPEEERQSAAPLQVEIPPLAEKMIATPSPAPAAGPPAPLRGSVAARMGRS